MPTRPPFGNNSLIYAHSIRVASRRFADGMLADSLF
jgi:hypothetical protein